MRGCGNGGNSAASNHVGGSHPARQTCPEIDLATTRQSRDVPDSVRCVSASPDDVPSQTSRHQADDP